MKRIEKDTEGNVIMAILDSSVIIELLRGNSKVIKEIEELNERLNTTLINFYEVVRGLKRGKEGESYRFL